MLQAHFGPIKNTNTATFTLSTKSSWIPPNPHHTVKTFTEAVEKDLKDNITNHKTNKNLSKEEIISLNKLNTEMIL